MKVISILHFVTLLFIFAPFFQMCENKSEPNLASVVERPDGIRDTAQKIIEAPEEQSDFKFSDVFVLTGPTQRGYEVLAFQVLVIIDGGWAVNDLPASFTSASILLSCLIAILLFRRRFRWVMRLYVLDIAFVIAAFIAGVILFDKPGFIKWGFYSYAVLLTLTCITFYRSRRSN